MHGHSDHSKLGFYIYVHQIMSCNPDCHILVMSRPVTLGSKLNYFTFEVSYGDLHIDIKHNDKFINFSS